MSDIIKVHDNDGGWWKGTLLPDGIYGTFPSNFVEVLDESNGFVDNLLPPSRPQSQQRHHSRHSSVDSSKFTKRKPVNTQLAKAMSPIAASQPYAAPTTNVSSVSLGAPSRKNPQAIIGDSGLCSSIPGAFPESLNEPQTSSTEIFNKAAPNPAYSATEQRRRNSTHSTLLNPSSPNATLSPPKAAVSRQVSNRFSMPNLAGDALRQLQTPSPTPYNAYNGSQPGTAAFVSGTMYHQDSSEQGTRSTSTSRSASHLPPKQDSHREHNHSRDSQHLQPGMMPRSTAEYYSQQFGPDQHGPHVVNGGIHPQYTAVSQQPMPPHQSYGDYPQHRPGYRHSIANIGELPLEQVFYNHDHSKLSSENLAKHNLSQNAMDRQKPLGSHGSHGRSRSQVNMRLQGAPMFNPYDHQQQQQQQPKELPQPERLRSPTPSASVHPLPVPPRAPSPCIIIPQSKEKSQPLSAGYSAKTSSPTENSPTGTPGSAQHHRLPNSPPGPGTTDPRRTGTQTSAGTSMSGTSAFGGRELRRKSDTARMPVSATMTASTFTARKFSVDAKGVLASAALSTATASGSGSGFGSGSGSGTVPEGGTSGSSEDGSEDLEFSGVYTAKKPKTTLVRAFKQIINPKKVAEKDALRNEKEHFAWLEMQKSLKRVSSPEPGKERFDGNSEGTQEQDPFEVLKRCQEVRDVHPGPGQSGMLDFGPNTFVQVDKVARNVNQRGPHMTPQLLSQKYLTRPYSKSPLSKLRVLFIWVSENIRLEGGLTRDVSGGRYKLGPGGEYMAALASLAKGKNGNGTGGESPTLRAGAGTAPPSVFMAGVEEYARSFLKEDRPELVQDVLATRTCKTGEGFANLFAEMALAAGIEDVGVVKGYIKGPMDVFSKDVPAPNHAWNVVRIDGTYRFIDCCLASPYHPAHYPNRPQTASSFYFLTSPLDMALSHFPVFLTYQYITPSIPPQIFLQLPFVRPAFFDFGLSLPDFKRRTRLEIKDDEPIEVMVRIDGGGVAHGSMSGAAAIFAQGSGIVGSTGHAAGLFGSECLGRGCGEGVELRAEVEVMTTDGKVMRKRALAQVMICSPYQLPQNAVSRPQQGHLRQGSGSSSFSASNGTGGSGNGTSIAPATIAAASNRPYQSHHCTGIRIAKIKAVLPTETVVGAGGVRKGVLHIYAGRKVESAPSNANPYSLALTLPVRHTGSMSKAPFSLVVPHFSPYEFYIKAPQSELLYYPHTYKFCVLSLAAQAQATLASASTVAVADTEPQFPMMAGANAGANNSTISSGSGNVISPPRHTRSGTGGGSVTGSSSLNPQCKSQQQQQQSNGAGGTLRGPSAQTLAGPSHSTLASGTGTIRGGKNHHPYQNAQHYQVDSSTSMASGASLLSNAGVVSANGGSGVAVPRPERLVLRTQTNRVYRLVYNPVRQCHEAEVEVKERGTWECVRMDDGGKSRVGREGTGGVVIASWRCI
ncbi:hypothetical protein BC939DRAFT_62283 [Gamsiella multidivaricata]|uniref:uncharacterized protein n=1 Tax=Gamsiella multidivaricata TaxID=101098 RepID=UPI002220E2F0|nr:uncharacterized protein BC939DRAFT_62283 [Gamsiella multidivaricata]KAI7828647.1 hypothetical protein BC939DRAFT_62283 [Gamsiella multidivaricata]